MSLKPQLIVCAETVQHFRKLAKDMQRAYTIAKVMKVFVTLTTEKNPLTLMQLAADECCSVSRVEPMMWCRFCNN